MKNTVFSASHILLPDFQSSSSDFEKWAVIACDQFTSDISYWDRVESLVGSSESAYNYILPEAYLKTPREAQKAALLRSHMKTALSLPWKCVDGFVYLERTLTGGKTRCGILGMIDLEHYDYSPSSRSAVRATEQTVTDRIPPRREMRAAASIELPHIMIFADDTHALFEKAKGLAAEENVLYDFELMEGGGHIKGYALEGELADALSHTIAENERASELPYAVGDGNHSLAAAKSHYESVKDLLGEAASEHPARYALCEIVSIEDDAIDFEPIHRIVKKTDCERLLAALGKLTCEGDGAQCITVISAGAEKKLSFLTPTHAMTVGTLQNFIDAYLAENCGECDYIHGEDALRALARDEDSVAFMFEGFDKSRLFEYIADGPLPRKTFSMGDAYSKRYYLEARRITD